MDGGHPYRRHVCIRLSNEGDGAEASFVMMDSFRELPSAILDTVGPRRWEGR